jgi:hypothetical protein
LLVRESISFQRGLDPKRTLGIGFPMKEIYDALIDFQEKHTGISNIKEHIESPDEMGYSIESIEKNWNYNEPQIWKYIITYNIKSKTYFLGGKELEPNDNNYIDKSEHEFADIDAAISNLEHWIAL